MTLPHKLKFTLSTEGHTYGWKVDVCPGPPDCVMYEETMCVCSCAACGDGDHYECSIHEDKNLGWAPGCSIKLMEECGIGDWLDNVGPDMLEGEVEMSVDATVRWVADDAPMLEFGEVER